MTQGFILVPIAQVDYFWSGTHYNIGWSDSKMGTKGCVRLSACAYVCSCVCMSGCSCYPDVCEQGNVSVHARVSACMRVETFV